MASFDDYDTAFRVRNLVKQTAKNEIDKQRPAPRYAIVKTIDKEDRSVGVVFVGDDEDNIVRVPYNSVAPSAIGQAVKIGGPANDRVVEDTRGPDESEARIEALETQLAHWSKRAYACAKLTADYTAFSTVTKMPFNSPTGVDPYYMSVEADGSFVCEIPGDYRYQIVLQTESYRNRDQSAWLAVLPLGGVQFDVTNSQQGLLGGSGEYVSSTPYTLNGLQYLGQGDKIYLNIWASSNTDYRAYGCRMTVELINPDPIVYPE